MNKRILSKIMSLVSICSLLGTNKYNDAMAADTSTRLSEFVVEKQFAKCVGLGIEDIINRLTVDIDNKDKVLIGYEVILIKKGTNSQFSKFQEWDCGNPDLRLGIKNMLVDAVKQAIDELERADLFLPSLNKRIYMGDGKKLVEQWKKNNVFETKINEIVEPYIAKAMQKCKTSWEENVEFQVIRSFCRKDFRNLAREYLKFIIRDGQVTLMCKNLPGMSENHSSFEIENKNLTQEFCEKIAKMFLKNVIDFRLAHTNVLEEYPALNSLELSNSKICNLAKGLIAKWKRENIYEEKLDEMVTSYELWGTVEGIYEHFLESETKNVVG